MRRIGFWMVLMMIFVGIGAFSFVLNRDHGWLLLPGSTKDLSALFAAFKRNEKPESFLDLSELYQGPEQKQVLRAFLDRTTLPANLVQKSCETSTAGSVKAEIPRCDSEPVSVSQIAARTVSPRSTFSKVSELSEDEVRLLIRGVPSVLTKDYLFLKDERELGFSPLAYWVYYRSIAEKKLAGTKYQLVVTNTDNACLFEVGNLCWTFNSNFILGSLYRYSFFITFLVFSFLLCLVAFFWIRFADKNQEQQRSRLALQVLSHEFRTPVSSMLLLLEQLSKLKEAGASEQDAITRLEAEAFRLQRVVEVSKNYLQAGSRRLHSKLVTIPSLNDWCADFVAELGIPIQLRTLAQDISVEADPFWLSFIISNLIQNAVAHGAQPIVLELTQRRRAWGISIQDNGQCEFKSFEDMAVPFKRSTQSRGMGLGLNMIQYITDELGGTIAYRPQPTTFTVAFKLGRS